MRFGDLVEKAKVFCKINDISFETLGNLNDNILTFTDNSHNNIIFDYTKMIMMMNNDYEIDFKKRIISIDKNIKFDIVVNEIICNNNEVKINYEIGEQHFCFLLTYTKILKG